MDGPQGPQAVPLTPNRGYEPEDEYHPEVVLPQSPAWMDGSYRIGIHTSIAGHVTEALEIAQSLGANALQIFSASPRMWNVGSAGGSRGETVARGRFTATEAEQFRARREELKLGPLVIHANYLINLASPDRVLRVRSIQAFHDEIVRAVALGADYLVVHPGSSKGGDGLRAIDAVADSLRASARGIKLGRLRILLENTAGQGTALGATFSELKRILDACSELPLGVCVDTAHLLAAGFDVASPQGLEKTLHAIEATVGLARVYVVHVNDSKSPLGSRVDRHQHIGLGHIGLEAFARILNHPLLAPAKSDTPQQGVTTRAFILETPIDKPGDDRRNLAALWKLVGRQVAAAEAKDGFPAGRKPARPKMKKQKTRRATRKVQKSKSPRRRKESGKKSRKSKG